MAAATSCSGEVDATGADSTPSMDEDIAPSLFSTLLLLASTAQVEFLAQLPVDSILSVARAVSIMRPHYRVVSPAGAGS